MVRLPKEDGKRAKGYGYVEFETRASLIAALNKPDTIIKNRQIKIDLSTADSRGGMNRGGPRGNRDGGMRSDMGGPDRTAGNWRSARDDFEDRPGGFDRGGGGRGFGGDGRRDFSSGSGGGFRGGFDREERGFRDGGFREDRGFDNRDRDRGFQRDDRREYGDRFKDDRGGFRDNRDRGGFRDRAGFDDDRRYDNDDRGGGATSWREGPPRETFSDRGFDRRDDRRRDDRDPPSRFERGPPRRDDLPPPDRAPPMERKKLNLQPRSSNPPPENKPAAPVVSSSIFGGAKPVDTTAREREVEERLAKGEDFSSERSGGNRSGPGSTSGGSTKDHQECERERDRAVEPAPPPKENAWHRKQPTSPVVNNGRTTPEGPTNDERRDDPKSWGRDREGPRRNEPRRTEDQKSNRAPPKSGPPSGPDKGRPKEDRPPHKSREPRNIDDVSKMPKVVENKSPNFTAPNKYTMLEEQDTPE